MRCVEKKWTQQIRKRQQHALKTDYTEFLKIQSIQL